uniref:Uncharacterized protein n=1 Tax=Strombidium rassoulzadegani TaxID=1082188 RepID=A0A7S3FVF4_9SPIT|mmetsp:Transcript_11394/g.19220  ORF Transcript_11394/g.19220 Transcript_11394/m.19220 type:complete len:194 (+) Transcript_11394:721-1302(+)
MQGEGEVADEEEAKEDVEENESFQQYYKIDLSETAIFKERLGSLGNNENERVYQAIPTIQLALPRSFDKSIRKDNLKVQHRGCVPPILAQQRINRGTNDSHLFPSVFERTLKISNYSGESEQKPTYDYRVYEKSQEGRVSSLSQHRLIQKLFIDDLLQNKHRIKFVASRKQKEPQQRGNSWNPTKFFTKASAH